MNRSDWSPHVPDDADLARADEFAGSCRVTDDPPGPNAVLVSDLTAEIRRLWAGVAAGPQATPDQDGEGEWLIRYITKAGGDLVQLWAFTSSGGQVIPVKIRAVVRPVIDDEVGL